MVIALLLLIGLVLGSFVNALVWRIYETSKELDKKKPSKQYLRQLSVTQGRSICPHCKHRLRAKDLVPVFSWISLKGRCRYCKKPISWQYPLVEVSTALVFLASYIWWPYDIQGIQFAAFSLWLVIITICMALAVYDIRWGILPNVLTYPLIGIALVFGVLQAVGAQSVSSAFYNLLLACLVGGGIFWLLYHVPGKELIGGGDVTLGWSLGLMVGTPGKSLLFIMLASVLGSLLSLPLLASKRLKIKSTIPFGPLLIVGEIITVLFGTKLIDLYVSTLIR